MKRLAVLASGGGTDLQSIIDAVESGKINGKIVCVISDKEDAYALKRAENHSIRAEYVKRGESDTLLSLLKSLEVDYVILAGYLGILPEILIQTYPYKIINIHPSLIPSFCGMGFYGMRVHQAVYDRGVRFTGATVHFVDEGADTGKIIKQVVVEIDEEDTPETIQKKVLAEEHVLLPEVVGLLCEDKVTVRDGRVKIEK
ncbi:MAG: phosphoribosylglycinamide formyltransferase [Clostridia bacterium]|nr:phosphoribosylglycinamide formyltransferase [Clostridia bacterium]